MEIILYKYNISSTIEPKEWNKNLEKSQYANFFQTVEYLNSQAFDENNYLRFITIEDEQENIIGQLGIIITQKHQAYSSKLFSKIFEMFSDLGKRGSWAGGPIIHEINEEKKIEVLKKIILALEEIGNNEGLAIIDGYSPHLDFSINERYINEYKKSGFDVNNFLTFVTDLNEDLNYIWEKIHDSTRRDVNRAEKRGLIVKELTTLDELDQYFNLNKIWAKTKGIELQFSAHYKENYWNCLKSNVEKLFLAYEDNELVSSHRLGCFNKIAFSHKITNSYSKPTSLGGPLLTWFAIKWAKENDIRYYDYSGGQAPSKSDDEQRKYSEQWDSLLNYKRKWGGSEYPYYHFVKIIHPFKYKMFRLLTKPDWTYRDYKRRHFKRPKAEN